jgi:hypothetical protein
MLASVLLLVGLGLVAGCDSSTGPDDLGRMTVLLTDAPFPFDLVAEANVTIGRVELLTENGIQILTEDEQIYNLLDLQNGVTATLASTPVPEGRVVQIRLIVTAASVVLTDDTTFDLQVPSGAQTGIKILTPGAEIEIDAQTSATLDMDVSDSFVVLGNPDSLAGIQGFIFTPVVTLSELEIASEGS